MVDVYLAPGHGRRPDGTLDSGALSGTKSEQSEGDLILRACKRRLVEVYGLTVFRQPKGGPNFQGTTTDINRRQPTCAIELHHDWTGAPRGGFGFVVPASQDQHSMRGEQLRIEAAIRNAYVGAGLPTRRAMGLLPGTTVAPYISRFTRYPTVLWEADRIGSVEDHGLYGETLADGVAVYLGALPVTAPEPEWVGKQVRARVDLRFYDRPGWYPANRSAGVIRAGQRFAGGVHERRRVGAGHQYLVSNSAGRRVWITANPAFVSLVSP